MPTIEVDDETYNFLKECGEMLRTQDNRCTANVIFFNEYPDKTYAEYGDDYHSDGYEWYCSDWDSTCENNNDLLKILSEYYSHGFGEDTSPCDAYMELIKLYELVKDEDSFEIWFDKIIKDSYEKDLIDIIKDFEYHIDFYDKIDFSLFDIWKDIYRISYSEKDIVDENGLFSFFSRDVEYHKKMDGHNYRKGQFSYAGSIQRSPLMLQLREWLMNQKF